MTTGLGPPGIAPLAGPTSLLVPPIGGTVTAAPPIGGTSLPVPPIAPTSTPSSSSSQFDEGLALFVTFAILFVLATQQVTAKFALWVGIALVAIVWTNAIRSGNAKTFWNSL